MTFGPIARRAAIALTFFIAIIASVCTPEALGQSRQARQRTAQPSAIHGFGDIQFGMSRDAVARLLVDRAGVTNVTEGERWRIEYVTQIEGLTYEVSVFGVEGGVRSISVTLVPDPAASVPGVAHTTFAECQDMFSALVGRLSRRLGQPDLQPLVYSQDIRRFSAGWRSGERHVFVSASYHPMIGMGTRGGERLGSCMSIVTHYSSQPFSAASYSYLRPDLPIQPGPSRQRDRF